MAQTNLIVRKLVSVLHAPVGLRYDWYWTRRDAVFFRNFVVGVFLRAVRTTGRRSVSRLTVRIDADNAIDRARRVLAARRKPVSSTRREPPVRWQYAAGYTSYTREATCIFPDRRRTEESTSTRKRRPCWRS